MINKKTAAVLVCFGMLCAASGCEAVRIEESSMSEFVDILQSSGSAEESGAEQEQTAEGDVQSADTEQAQDVQTAQPKDTPATSDSAQDGGSAVSYDPYENADTPQDDAQDNDDDAMIAMAQYLYNDACLKEWAFSVGCPYELDMSQYIVGNYDWQYYLVTDPSITSLDDVKADYHEVFSDDQLGSIPDVYKEQDGMVYCLAGARGSNIFFEQTVLTAITSRSANEMHFTAQSSYSDDGFGNGPTVIEDDFAIVKDRNGNWKVKKFRLPY